MRSHSLLVRFSPALLVLVLPMTLLVLKADRVFHVTAGAPAVAAPSITPAAGLSRQQGAGFSTVAIATVSDDQTPAGDLQVTTFAPAGISILNITNNNGTISASLAAGCNATPGINVIALTVTDNESLSTTANLNLNVTANTAPTLGSYAATSVGLNSSATIKANAAPNDNGSFTITTQAPGFTGTISVNQTTGTLTISNAAPVGVFTVTMTAMDLCGATTSGMFVLTVLDNTPPVITAAQALSQLQGSSGTATLVSVSDAQSSAASLIVKATLVPPGITISNLTNTNGQVSANVAVACNATLGANTVGLTVNDPEGLTTTANFTVNVLSNTPPVLGAYPPVSLNAGESLTIVPGSTPTDNGSIATLTADATAGFTGTLSASKTTGAIAINNAGPPGVYPVSVTATDNCGATTVASFKLTVISLNPSPTITSLSPASVFAGNGGFSLTINGTNFVNGSVVRWNGQDRITGFISVNKLSALITAADIASAGSASVTVFNPAPGGGLSNATAFAINGQADLAVTQSFSPSPVGVNGTVTYTITITNNGPGAASQVKLTDDLPTIVSFGSCTASNGGVCSGTALNRIVSIPSIAAGASATITLTATVGCLDLTGPIPQTNVTIINTATVSAATPDPNTLNNISTKLLNFTSAQAKITLSSPTIDFGPLPAARETNPNPPFYTFTIENPGCQQLFVYFAVIRTGADVTSGKISNSDDSVTFPIQLINSDGSAALVLSGQSAPVFGGKTVTFRLLYDPKAPAPAGKITGLAAHQAIPDLITSSLIITPSAGSPLTIPMTGRVTPAAKLINPLAPRLAPLVVLQKSGADEFTVELSLHDPNLDVNLIRYQFLDGNGHALFQPPDINLNLASANLVRGQSVTIVKKFTGANNNPRVQRVQVTLYDPEVSDSMISPLIGTVAGRIVNVSAANFSPAPLAAESIASAFGTNLATTITGATTLPLPTTLGGTRVFVTDSENVEREAALFFVSPQQVNYLIPANTAPGEAKVIIASDDGSLSSATMQVAPLAPSLFSANADGTGVASAFALRVAANNAQSYETIAEYDGRQFVATPIDFGSASDQIYLVLYGTGLRHRSELSQVTAKIGGTDVEVLYAGPQGDFAGLDQVNLKLPRSLAGRGETDIALMIDGRAANLVRVSFR